MKRQRSNGWTAAALGALALLAWLAAAFLAQQCAAWSGGAVVRWSGETGVSPAQLRQAQRYAREDGVAEPPALTLWRERPGESLTDETRRRSAEATVLELLGDGGGLWPAGFVSGNYPAQGDGQGCAVDRAVAEALWGTGHAVGQAVCWQGKTYYVRGVFQGTDGLMMVQGDETSAEPWPNLLLAFPDGDQKARTEAFLSRNQFPRGQILDQSLLAWCLEMLSALPALVLALGLLGRLLGRGRTLAGRPALLGQYLPLGLVGAGAALWCLGLPSVPGQLIPTRWSDLDFWARLWTERLGGVRDHLTLAPTARDLRYWPAVLAGVLLALCAFFLTILAAERARAGTGKALLLGWAAALGSVFIGSLAFAGVGGVAVSRQMWLLPPLWLGVDWALARHEGSLTPRGDGYELEET